MPHATRARLSILALAALVFVGLVPATPAAAASAVGAGTYEESDAAIVYTGSWTRLGSSGSSGGAIRYATGTASATLTFTGPNITWYTWRSASGGIVDVYLDGVRVDRVDNYAPTTTPAVRGYTAQDLSSGTHTIRIASSGTANPKSSGRITHLDSFVVGASHTARSTAAISGIRSSDCPAATVRVSDSAKLRSALASAKPGAVIELAPGTYANGFALSASGTASKPIWICGPRTAVVQGGSMSSGTALRLDSAKNVRVTGFTVAGALQGVMVKFGSNVAVTDLHVRDIGYEGIHLYAFTSDSYVVGNRIERTGRVDVAYGEGVYIGTSQRRWAEVTGGQPDRSDRNVVALNTISSVGAEHIDAKEGTTGGVIAGNTFSGHLAGSRADGWVLVTGNDWVVEDNTGSSAVRHGFASHVWDSWGKRNSFTSNSGDGSPGYGLWMQSASAGVEVTCDNWVTAASLGVTNVFCRP